MTKLGILRRVIKKGWLLYEEEKLKKAITYLFTLYSNSLSFRIISKNLDQSINSRYYSNYLWCYACFYDTIRCFFSSTLVKSVNPGYKHEKLDFIGGTKQQLLHFVVVVLGLVVCLLLLLLD